MSYTNIPPEVLAEHILPHLSELQVWRHREVNHQANTASELTLSLNYHSHLNPFISAIRRSDWPMIEQIYTWRPKVIKAAKHEPLVAAIRADNLSIIKWLVERGADVQARGGMALSVAAAHASLEVVEYLQAREVRLPRRFRLAGNAPSTINVIAARCGNLKLLTANGGRVRMFDAVMSGSIQLVDCMIERNYHYNQITHQVDLKSEIREAIRLGYFEIANRLWSYHPEYRPWGQIFGPSPATDRALEGDLGISEARQEQLIQMAEDLGLPQGVVDDPGDPTRHHPPLINSVVSSGAIRLFDYLYARDSNPEQLHQRNLFTTTAAYKCQLAMLQYLVKLGFALHPDLLSVVARFDSTVDAVLYRHRYDPLNDQQTKHLFQAAQQRLLELFTYLIEQLNYDPASTNTYLLYHAADKVYNTWPVVEYLITAGANPNNQSALEVLIDRNKYDDFEQLLKHQDDPDIADLLQQAVDQRRMPFIKLLLPQVDEVEIELIQQAEALLSNQ